MFFFFFLLTSPGDLTDAKDAYLMDSMQHLEEWKEYSRILKDTRVLEKTKWVDIRGNHGKK